MLSTVVCGSVLPAVFLQFSCVLILSMSFTNICSAPYKQSVIMSKASFTLMFRYVVLLFCFDSFFYFDLMCQECVLIIKAKKRISGPLFYCLRFNKCKVSVSAWAEFIYFLCSMMSSISIHQPSHILQFTCYHYPSTVLEGMSTVCLSIYYHAV